ncbi:MAG: GNAT family N-acetyltransferase [Proteobacteria bacterium]|nr:GNAT family N-acetyltransferase [Pseudomonadota bacterium]
MTRADLDTVMRIQRKAYQPFFHETKEVFSSRLHIYPEGCWIAARNGQAVGYLFSHPWYLNDLPGLDRALMALPDIIDCYHIHDLAVDPNFAGHGIGRASANKAVTLCRRHSEKFGHTTATLVAVQDSQGFWAKFGFTAQRTLASSMRKKLTFYGPNARFMVWSLPQS